MTKQIIKKSASFILIFIFLFSCKKEEVTPPDPILGNWQLVSFSGEGQTVVWDEFKTLAVSLIPEYECMSWTAAITEELLTENVTLIDEFSNGCIPEKITVWAWERTKGTNEYTFNQGLITYRIYNINVSGNQMTWTEQSADEVVTVWSKIEE